MHILAGLFLFVVLAIGAAMDGDYSGLEAIGKFLLGVFLMVAVMWLITSKVYILLLIIGGIILVAKLCKL